MGRIIQSSAEFRRIRDLPRRQWDTPDVPALVKAMSDYLRTVRGEWDLRAIQAVALAEAHDYGGLFLQARVGAGKTLLSMLLPTILEAERPLLFVPANLKDKTIREFSRILRPHWKAGRIKVESYEKLSRVSKNMLKPGGDKMFAAYRPDLIILDEASCVKNPDAACTLRLDRYIHQCRADGIPLVVCAMSGTITKRSIKDFWHILHWCLPHLMPLPIHFPDLAMWASAVDEKVKDFERVAPGVLLQFATEEDGVAAANDVLVQAEQDPELRAALQLVTTARLGVSRRLFDTPGVLATTEAGVSCSLQVNCHQVDAPPVIKEAFSHLRTAWETPDGHTFSDKVTLWRHARELAMGFYGVWDPRPSDEWLVPRREWHAAVRQVIGINGLDSEFQVASEVAHTIGGRKCPQCGRRSLDYTCGWTRDEWNAAVYQAEQEDEELPDLGHPVVETVAVPPGHHPLQDVYLAWHSVRDTFTPNSVPVWLSDHAIEWAAEWSRKNTGIIWTEHTAFAERLSKVSGLAYFGRKGRDAKKRMIEDADPRESLIASIKSNHKGRNLQAWCKALVTSAPPTGNIWEQMLGREHRDGQEADAVIYDVMIGCLEQFSGFMQAKKDCMFSQNLARTPMKLCYADITLPEMYGSDSQWAA